LTPTPTTTPQTQDFYLANQYQCGVEDCLLLASNVLVYFPIGTPVTLGLWYRDVLIIDAYEVIATATGPGGIELSALAPGQVSCVIACSL